MDKYNRIGVLIDGATEQRRAVPAAPASSTAASSPPTRSSAACCCTNFQQTGNCSASGQPGNNLVTTGPLFGQDGVRIVGGAARTLTGNAISQNLVGGLDAPVRNAATNNANLRPRRRHRA